MGAGSEGPRRTETDPDIRRLFSREALHESGWYALRLRTKQERDIALWQRHLRYLDEYPAERLKLDPSLNAMLTTHRELAAMQLERVRSAKYLQELRGTIGAQPRV
jgi:hypothetical protein